MKQAVFLLLFLPISPIFSQDIDQAIHQFSTLEQVVAYQGTENQKEWRKEFLLESKKIIAPFLDEIKNLLGTDIGQFQFSPIGEILNDPFPAGFDFEKKNFYSDTGLALHLKTIEKKTKDSITGKVNCNQLKVIYLFTIWYIESLKPSFEYESIDDLLVSYQAHPSNPNRDTSYRYQMEIDLYRRDKNRAAFAFKYHPLFEPENHCVILKNINLNVEFQKRMEYLSKVDPQMKKPLGFAIGMCGRTMLAHYVDEEAELGKREDNLIYGKKAYDALFKTKK